MYKLTLACFPIVIFSSEVPAEWEAKLTLTILDPLNDQAVPIEYMERFVGKSRREASDLAMAFVTDKLKHL